MMICFLLNIMSAFTVVVRVLRCVMDNETTPKTKNVVGNENEKKHLRRHQKTLLNSLQITNEKDFIRSLLYHRRSTNTRQRQHF